MIILYKIIVCKLYNEKKVEVLGSFKGFFIKKIMK